MARVYDSFMDAANVTKKLDVTQFQDMSDEQLLHLGLTADEIKTLRGLPRTKLSSMIPLVVATGKKKAEYISELLPTQPEIDINGNRRCVFLHSSGSRCEAYGGKDLPVCKKHSHAAASLGSYFESPKLREIYNAHVNSPDRLKSDGEIALMRTMLSTMLSKLDEGTMNMELIGAVSVLAEKITTVVERMSKLSAITPEDLQKLMRKMVDVASEFIPPDKLEAFAKKVDEIDLNTTPTRMRSGIRFEPGDVIEGVTLTAEKDATLPPKVDTNLEVQRKALLETAVRLSVVDNEAL